MRVVFGSPGATCLQREGAKAERRGEYNPKKRVAWSGGRRPGLSEQKHMRWNRRHRRLAQDMDMDMDLAQDMDVDMDLAQERRYERSGGRIHRDGGP